jgi:4-hydroxy-3-polyprenylbenzoate decarboxylase
MAWPDLRTYLRSLEDNGDLLRISHPVDVHLEAGCIADKFVKRSGQAIIFDQPRLANGRISEFPLVMNLFGTRERVNKALGVEKPEEIGERMVALMKPDIGAVLKNPFSGIGLAKQGMSMAPKRIKKGACQAIRIENPDITKLPIPTTWPQDGGPFMTLPLVITQDPKTGHHNMGMYRSQVFGPTEVGLHWQAHKHGAEHAEASADSEESEKMPIAICLGGPPHIMFSAISPLPDNLSEYEFAGILSGKRLKIAKCLTNDLWIPADCDFVIEGYTIPGETRTEGPFGDHFGHYSLTGEYPVMHITAITHRKQPSVPMTIVGLPPMEDGYLGEAIGDAFLPVLKFQHTDVSDLFLPLETGFHNLAIVASKQRYPRQARKTALGLLGAGQMMFLKSIVAVDENHEVKDLNALLRVIDYNVRIPEDITILDGMVADTLAHAAPWENVHSKLIIDASTLSKNDPRVGEGKQMGCPDSLAVSASGVDEVVDGRMLGTSMLVVTTKIADGPMPEFSMEEVDEAGARAQREQIARIREEIWSLEAAKNLRWLFITDDDADLRADDWKRRLLWQLFCRFEVARDLHFDEARARIAWDATAPIPSLEGPLPVRRWPAVTLHDSEIEGRIDAWIEENGL